MPDLGVPGLDQPVPKNWITLEDDFVLVYGVIQVQLDDHVSRSRPLDPFPFPDPDPTLFALQVQF